MREFQRRERSLRNRRKVPIPAGESVMEDTQRPASEKVVHFTRAEPRDEPDKESEAIKEIKNQVRHAMEVLEQGKQVAAFNLLKRILDL
jgi:hypothetical protein